MPSVQLNSICKLFAVSIASLLACSCASLIRPVMPEIQGGIAVQVKYLDLGLSRPYGSYAVKGGSFNVGQATITPKGEAAFGALGAITGHSSRAKEAQDIIAEYETILRYDLVDEIKSILADEVRNSDQGTALNPRLPQEGNTTMVFEPWVYFGMSKDKKYGIISVYLRTLLNDKKGKKLWRSGYNCKAPNILPIEGEDGWFYNNGENLKKIVRNSYQTAIKVMLQDMLGEKAGWDEDQKMIRIASPGDLKPGKSESTILKKESGMIIFSPKIMEAAYIYGINIVPENEVEVFNIQQQS